MKEREKNIYKLARTREMKTREVPNRLQDKRNKFFFFFKIKLLKFLNVALNSNFFFFSESFITKAVN